MKTCNKCNEEKSISEFYAANRGIHNVRGECKVCTRKQKALYRAENKTKLQVRAKAFYEKTKEHHLAQKKQYRQLNKSKINALGKAYKIAKIKRMPKWVDSEELWLIKEVYDLAALRTKLFGFSWHVDHIIPLQGKTVSGLHTISNLQVIPWIDNVKKKNRFEVA